MEDNLLIRAQKGDEEAFEALFATLQERVYRTCVHLLGTGEEAEDCAQETLLKAFRTLREFRGECALTTWLHRLCVTVCIDSLRKTQRRQTESLDALRENGFDPPSREPLPAEALEKKERIALLRQAIAALPEEQRLAFVLTVLEDVSYADAAAQLQTSVGTVKSRVSRAREKLLKIYGAGGELFAIANVQQSEGRDENEL